MVNMMNSRIIGIICAIIFLASCASKKNKSITPPVVINKIDTAIHNPTASDILSFTIKPWTFFSSKIDFEFRQADGKKINANGSIRMYKDSLIWISAGMFGLEGFRILINKDSVLILNKLEKKYNIYKTSEFKGLSDVTLTVTQIQNIIIANPIYALKLYSISSQNDGQISIEYPQKKYNTLHSYKKQSYTIDSSYLMDNLNPNYAKIVYSEYSVFNNHNFPTFTFIQSKFNNKNTELELKYSDIDFETVLSFPCQIPSSYEKAN
jgi:hypothetical protein